VANLGPNYSTSSRRTASDGTVSFLGAEYRIWGHIDTGYDANHVGRPARAFAMISNNFGGVLRLAAQQTPEIRNRNKLFDNFGGTATGPLEDPGGRPRSRRTARYIYLGGRTRCPLSRCAIGGRTSASCFDQARFAQALEYATRCPV